MRIAQAALTTPASARKKQAHCSLGQRIVPFSRWVVAYPRAMMKKVVNTSAMRTPCAVTDM